MRPAETALTALAQSADPRDPVIGAALLAILYEDFGLTVLLMPAPAAIARDPELARVYASSMDSAVRPMLQRAADAYQFCEARPGAPDWSAFCTQRLGVLRASGRIEPAAPPATTATAP
jgi:hypothetical protein